MDKTRILSGEQLVHNGALKVNCTLPELGLKDVTPNGSWLEQKQIQAALEARKHLIEIERIEKSGVLSHAEWCEDLKLAEVTQKVGGYWQYLGHNVGKQLFLNPEEALFLMEVNCLLLKYDGVKVSLQQAYALVLKSGITMTQYKVYASLSRLGYRVYRHTSLKNSCSTENPNNANDENVQKEPVSVDANTNNDISTETVINSENEDNAKSKDVIDDEKCNEAGDFQQTETGIDQPSTSRSSKKANTIKSKISKYVQYKIRKLNSRKFKPSSHSDFIITIPDFTKDSEVTINTPPSVYLPAAIASTSHLYRLNLDKISSRSAAETIPRTNIPDSSVNMDQLRARFSSPNIRVNHNFNNTFNFRFPQQPNPFNIFNFWRLETNYSFFQVNMNFPFGPGMQMNYPSQSFFLPRLFNTLNSNLPNLNTRKRTKAQVMKKERLEQIQHFASIVKRCIISSRDPTPYITKLQDLIKSFNERYKARIRVSDDFTINYGDHVVETVELDDDDQQTAKKPRKNDDPFEIKLNKLEQMAYRLKLLHTNNQASSQHRRMFNKLIKRFNDAYNVDYYLDDDFYIINRNDLTVNSSSSDVETIPENTITVATTSKKLKNPFSIIKQLSEKQKETNHSTSQKELPVPTDFDCNSNEEKAFDERWLPPKSDFGRPEIISNKLAKTVLDISKEDLIFDFMKMQPDKFNNWLDAKITLLECLQKTSEVFADIETQDDMTSKSLVNPKDFSSSASVLKALSIIKSHNKTSKDTNLVVDFDVYKRDTPNFKKSNRPLPLFRVVCLRESSSFPIGADVASLHSNYKDGVTILFALIENNSISYLQVNPIELPVYLPSTENTV